MRCGYCSDGPYKKEHIDIRGGVGGFINGYWFCQWCLEYGMRDKADSEKERYKMLVDEAGPTNRSDEL